MDKHLAHHMVWLHTKMNESASEILGEVTPRRPTMFCPHCGQFLMKSTFYCHRREFYNPMTKSWEKHKKMFVSIMKRDETTSTHGFHMDQDNLHAINLHAIPDFPWLDPEVEDLSSLLPG